MLRTFVELCHRRQKMELELRGKVLIVQERAWAHSTTLYVPPGGFDLARRYRRDRGVLYIAGARIFGIAAAVAILYACWLTLELHTDDIFETLEATAVGMSMVGLPIFAIIHLIYSLIRFSNRIPTVRLHIRDEQSGIIPIEFWHRKDAPADVGEMIDRLESIAIEYQDHEAHVAQLGFFWQTLPPMRHALYQAISWSFALVIALQLVRFVWRFWNAEDIFERLPTSFIYIFALPWIISFGIYAYHRILMRAQPEQFRIAVRLMFKEDYAESVKILTTCMEKHPEHMPTLGLLIQLHVRQFSFDEAFKVCNVLERTEPEAAQEAQANIWAMKRLQAQMDED